ncbi:MAG TPA: hypothetical protein PLE59_02555 [Bacteroidales bacterium]|jgi:hypothetical protein|nr:hypothetical protein [Bacteroidales bacterium]HON98205.1 hypothetical protein [Bacteroidales bacterium]HOU81852.1 hypothetical protein [Bacteroidales bacterium]HPL02382.1 hypothetical protein [Bacteroidales bacterium]HQH58841.1 hypothetical protein [Bacteroidales bacterium]
MKKIAFTYLILFFFSLNVLAQKTDKNNFSLGLFIGEGTGVLTNFSISDKFKIEWNIAYNELFYKYGYTNRNPHFIGQKYNNIYSSSLLLIYKNKFMGINKLNYHFAIGSQIRLITDYNEGMPDSIPPNVIIIYDPTPKNKIDLGINSLIGLEYELNKNISVFFDLGAYIEIIDVFLWSNFQFRTGLIYRLNYKKKE